MELSLSLGDSSKSTGFLPKNRETTANNNLGLCMALGISSNRRQEEERERENLDADDESDDVFKKISAEPPVQLDLFSLAPVHRSSDNGSSEGGSSEKMGLPPAVEEGAAAAVSSPNSAASSFRMDFGIYRGGNKRDSEAAGNDAVEAERASSRASDDDENGLARKKLRLSKDQSAYLEESFKEHNTLNPKQKQALAKQLGLRPRQVEVWFQNRRARTKLKQTEVDCEYLKRCCETLTDENRRLHKELQELRALKTSNPFQMQLPATTLTMCPSCERVATTSATTAPPTTTTTTTTTTNTTSKATPFPLSRPRVLPFFQTQFHPHQSAAS